MSNNQQTKQPTKDASVNNTFEYKNRSNKSSENCSNKSSENSTNKSTNKSSNKNYENSSNKSSENSSNKSSNLLDLEKEANKQFDEKDKKDLSEPEEQFDKLRMK